MASLNEQRRLIRTVIDSNSAADAPTAYYLLHHPAQRSALYSRTAPDTGAAVGAVGVFQTGVDLFRPLVAMRCWRAEVAADLLGDALTVGRPYMFFSNLNQLSLAGGSLQVENQRIMSIYVLDPGRFKREVNVLVRVKNAPDGTPRAEIESAGVRAMAGVNWQSPGFAEVFVHVDPEARQKGWGRSVALAVTERVLAGGRLPLYLVEPNNEASVKLAESVGYGDTGARQVMADAVYLGHPGRR